MKKGKTKEEEPDGVIFCEDCGIWMNYIGEISVWQLWQCPKCKDIEITNF